METKMSEEQPYITDLDKQEYRRFAAHHISAFARPAPPELWHYTSGEGLIAILTTGKIFSTQVTCLNDNLEQRYFGDLVYAATKQAAAQNDDATLSVLLKFANTALGDRDFSSAWHFATCFSEVEDDLGQWRGYGGGQCGYAIGFNFEELLKAISLRRNGALMIPMNYEEARQTFLVEDVIANAKLYFLDGAKKFADTERWATEFFEAFSWELDIYACMFKHPKFAGERERRIITGFREEDLPDLIFSQKKTLLARHLPIDLRLESGLLPISRIYVGPGPAQRVSQVGAGTLLKQKGYDVPVVISAVPYRVP
jgi:hypothetical protein